MTAPTTQLELLRISVRPSPDTNDHEVRLESDNGDLITRFADGLIGMDPDDLLIEPSPLQAGPLPNTVTIGRCDCGVVGCGSVDVTIRRNAGVVTWTTQERPIGVSFDADQYDAEVERATNDVSWETPDRTASRLIRAGVDHEALGSHGLRFCWASGRISERTMTVALECTPGPYQVLVHVAWPDGDAKAIARRCIDTLASLPASWSHVRWFPQAPGLAAPKIAGRGWQPGTPGLLSC